jgi:hypothetical protein
VVVEVVEVGEMGGDICLPGNDPPVISNLTYSPTSATYNPSGGQAFIDCSLDFADINCDAAFVKYQLNYSDGTADGGGTALSSGLKGKPSGTLHFTIGVPLAYLETWTIWIWVVDDPGGDGGVLSNPLYIQFPVTP